MKLVTTKDEDTEIKENEIDDLKQNQLKRRKEQICEPKALKILTRTLYTNLLHSSISGFDPLSRPASALLSTSIKAP